MARVGCRIAALCVVAVAAPGVASAYTPEPLPWANCSGAEAAAATGLEAHRLPADGAQAAAGAPLTFSATSGVNEIPLTFTIGSTPTLTGPPLDSALVTADATGYAAFTSAAAGATPGTIYWTVSYSTTALPSCAGLEPRTVTLPVRSLDVLAPAPLTGPGSVRRCTVPRLRGTSLARARALLRRAGCRLGSVTRRHGGTGTPIVRSQTPRAGAERRAGASVDVTLAPRSRAARVSPPGAASYL